MPSVAQMSGICDRLRAELQRGLLSRHRLLEIETVVRLLVPHLTRALADAVQRLGERPELKRASRPLMAMRELLAAIDSGRNAPVATIQQKLVSAVEKSAEVLEILERL